MPGSRFHRVVVVAILPAAGVIVLSVGIWGLVLARHVAGPDIHSLEGQVASVFPPEGTTGWRIGQFNVTLEGTVDYPRAPRAGDTFLIEAQLDIATITEIHPLGDPSPPDPEMDRHVRESFFRQPPPVTLSIAGMEVKPIDAVTPSPDGRVWWSVRPKDTGRFTGFIRAEDRITATLPVIGKREITFQTDGVLSFDMLVRHRLSTYWSWIATFLGSLLTLPGLLAYWDTIRKRRKAKQEKPKIVIP